MKHLLALILLIISLTACKSVERKYVTIDGNQDCCEMKFPIGKSEEKVYLSVANNLKITYSSAYSEAKNLKFLDVKLFIDGKEILPDKENYEAAFFDAFHPEKYKRIAKEDCCENLEKKLGFDIRKNPKADSFGVEITKSYESLENLPPNIEILLTATTDQKTFTKRRKLHLINYETVDVPFIRFH